MASYNGWVTIRELGKGAQGEVHLARRPETQAARKQAIELIRGHIRQLSGGIDSPQANDRVEQLADAVVRIAREPSPEELGAVKVFSIKEDGSDSREQVSRRLQNEFN